MAKIEEIINLSTEKIRKAKIKEVESKLKLNNFKASNNTWTMNNDEYEDYKFILDDLKQEYEEAQYELSEVLDEMKYLGE